MRDEQVEQRLRNAMDHAAPDVLERILASCGEQKGNVIAMKAPKKKKNMIPMIAAAAVVLVLVSALVMQWTLWQSASAAVITFDVNPSLSLSVDGEEQVVKATALNDDGRVVLDGMDLSGASLNVAVNAIIGSMLQHGYLDLDNFENAILVSVESGDAVWASQLQRQVQEDISGAFQQKEPVDALILTQTVSSSGELSAWVDEYGISMGKAALIQEIIAQDSTLTVQSLAPLSINEIALIADSRKLNTSSISQTGSASDAAYIGTQAAIDAAAADLGLSADDLYSTKATFDIEDGCMIYDVEFCSDGSGSGQIEHEYEIDACTGRVLQHHQEACEHGYHTAHSNNHHDVPAPAPSSNVPAPAPSGAPVSEPPSAPSQPLSTAYVGEDAAKNAALLHACVSSADTQYLNCWMEYDDGCEDHYEVEFAVNGVQYEYEIDLHTGAVLKCEQERSESGHHSESHHSESHHAGYNTVPSGTNSGYIGETAAINAALAHANVSVSNAYELEAELDASDGVYEVEFVSDSVEYEYEIDAYSGAIVKYESDRD